VNTTCELNDRQDLSDEPPARDGQLSKGPETNPAYVARVLRKYGGRIAGWTAYSPPRRRRHIEITDTMEGRVIRRAWILIPRHFSHAEELEFMDAAMAMRREDCRY
jgi:hypothetical protein